MELKPRDERCRLWSLEVKVERAEAIILIREIQYADEYFSATVRETVTAQQVALPEVRSGSVRLITAIVLHHPGSTQLREDA